MKNLYTSISFIFSMMCLAHIANCGGFTRTKVINKASVSLGVSMVQKLISEGKTCVGKDMFVIVRNDAKAILDYVAYICGKVPRPDAKAYIRKNYGTPKKLLGAGSFGKVYLFTNESAEKFAIKIPKNFNYKDLFMEINSSECIKENTGHKDVSTQFGLILSCVWPIRDTPNLVMKYLPESLASFNKTYFSQRWDKYTLKRQGAALDFMSMMAKELALMHSMDIAHRDLKPDNIMVNDQQIPVFVDFGLSTPMGKRSRTIGGTPYFLDYELINRNGDGVNADVYSMFIIYASMVVGPRFWSLIGSYFTRGGYDKAMKGKGLYKPKYDSLDIPAEWSWLKNMFKPIIQGRWNMQQVVE